MGLDMYLFKVKKLSESEDRVFKGQTFSDVAELSEKYSIWKNTEEIKAPLAVKKVGTPIKIKEKKFNILQVFKTKFPDRSEEDILDFNSENNPNGITLYYYVKGRQEPLIVDFLKDEFSRFLKEFTEDAYICNQEEVYYWRKANQVRKWFQTHLAEGVENCEYSTVTEEDIKNLIEDCISVVKDHSKANTVMPTSAGFFFGDTSYDEYYYDELLKTSAELSNILKDYNNETEAFMYTEWW